MASSKLVLLEVIRSIRRILAKVGSKSASDLVPISASTSQRSLVECTALSSGNPVSCRTIRQVPRPSMPIIMTPRTESGTESPFKTTAKPRTTPRCCKHSIRLRTVVRETPSRCANPDKEVHAFSRGAEIRFLSVLSIMEVLASVSINPHSYCT